MSGVNHITGENGGEEVSPVYVIGAPGSDAVFKYTVDDATWCQGIDYDGDGTNRPFKIAKTGPLGTGDVLSFEGTTGQTMRLPEVVVVGDRRFLAIDQTTKAVSADLPGIFVNTNTALGERTLEVGPSTGFNNACFGYSAGTSIDTSAKNVMVGAYAGTSNETGNDNVMVGNLAGADGVGLSSSTYVGYKTGNKCLVDGNTFVGYKAGQVALSTTKSVLVGANVAPAMAGGFANTGVGYESMLSMNGGGGNCAFGSDTLTNNVSGNDNTAIGYFSLRNTAAGTRSNTAVGANCLLTTTGDNNTGLGKQANVPGALTNSTAIGFSAACTASNQVMLGDVNVTEVKTAGGLTFPKPFGELWSTTSLITSGLTNFNWTVAPFTTTTPNANNQSFTHTLGKLTYTGGMTKNFHAGCTIAGFPDSNTDANWEFALLVNGSPHIGSIVAMTSTAIADRYSTAIHKILTLSTGDYVELGISRTAGTADWTTEYMNVFMLALPNEV